MRARRKQNWSKLIAVGYSFRDDPVNAAIMEKLDTQQSHLIVVNPNPKEVSQNIGEKALQKHKERIIPVKGRFGDEEVFQQLEIALKVDSRKRFFKRVTDVKGIESYWEKIDTENSTLMISS